MARRAVITLTFSADIDEVQGWGNELADWENYVRQNLNGNRHYHPSVEIIASKIEGETNMLGLLLALTGRRS